MVGGRKNGKGEQGRKVHMTLLRFCPEVQLHSLRCATGQALVGSALSLLRLHAHLTNREISAPTVVRPTSEPINDQTHWNQVLPAVSMC